MTDGKIVPGPLFWSNRIQSLCRIPDFPDVEGGGALTYYLAYFYRKLHENRNAFGSVSGYSNTSYCCLPANKLVKMLMKQPTFWQQVYRMDLDTP